MLLTNSQENLIQKFQPVFYPCSIAVVGSFSKAKPQGYFYWNILMSTGYKGQLYAVSRSGGELPGHKIYPGLRDIPGPVDQVYVCIPRHGLLELLDECAEKQVKVVSFFTAGFSEFSVEGRLMEEQLVEKAKKGGFRLIGPNCIGAYSPEINMMFSLPVFKGLPGDIAFICQSGSLYIKILQIGKVRGINFSKGISYGNGIDLDSVDFVEYYGADPKTKAIIVYIEGVRQGKRFLQVAREVSKKKPVIMVKGGRGEAGKRAISSHTGSLASSEFVWSALAHQAGIVMVDSIEEMTDTALALQKLGSFEGGVVALTGLANGGGGEAVLAADTFALNGMELPLFTEETQQELGKALDQVGSILSNPLDVSQAYKNYALITNAIEIALKDPQVTTLVALEYFDLHSAIDGAAKVSELNDHIIRAADKTGKKMVMVLPPALNEDERIAEEKRLNAAGIPVYPTLDRAAKALRNLRRLGARD